MKTSPDGIAAIKAREAFSGVIYDDEAGKATIGYGHLLTAEEIAAHTFDAGISEDQGERLLAIDLGPAEEAVSTLVTVPLTQPQYDALVSFAYNLGAGALAHSTLLRKINARAPFAEIHAEFLRWDIVHVDGKPVTSEGLRKRRAEEAAAWE